jgi:hypothetical protein
LHETSWTLERPEILNLQYKINKKGIKIKDILDLNFYIGLYSGANDVFFISKEKRDELISKDPKSEEIIKPLIRGKDLKKWRIDYNDIYAIISANKDINELKKFPFVFDHLKFHQAELMNRGTFKRGDHPWWLLSTNPSLEYLSEFNKPKLIYPSIASGLFTVLDTEGYFANNKCFIITSEITNLKYLSLILSSKTLNFIFKFLGAPLQGKYFDLNKNYVRELPIYPANQDQQNPFIDKANEMLQYNKDLNFEISGFKNWLKRGYFIDKLSKKLDKYYKLSFEEFLIELNKKKVDTKQRKTQELLKNEFEESVYKINPLLQQIKETDIEIDKMVYDLYGLTPAEIKIIEESLN